MQIGTTVVHSPDQIYAARAAGKLCAVLDEQGFPLDLFGRTNALSSRLEMGRPEATNLLSGQVPWTWDQIYRVCKAFSLEPGFLLDESEHEGVPSDTVVVPSVQGADSIVWRVPSGLSGLTVQSGPLKYLTLSQSVRSGEQVVMYLFRSGHFNVADLKVGSGYVLAGEDGGYSVMRFKKLAGKSAQFEGVDDSPTQLLPLEDRKGAGTELVGELVAQIFVEV